VANEQDTLLVKEVVREAVQLLVGMEGGKMPFMKPVEVPDITVGLDGVEGGLGNKRRVMQLLLEGGGSIRMVLLHGMGGIGKTTLARAVFNQLHASSPTLPCCFLGLDPGMKELQIVQKQQQLLHELACVEGVTLRNAEHGRRVVANELKGRRVLLVVDNAWDDVLEFLLPDNVRMQLLGEGSMVLVTSREHDAARHLQGVVQVEMECLASEPSAELFCQHAFPGPALAPSSWVQHVCQSCWASPILAVLQMCAGLPMALEVAGRYFAASDDKDAFHSSFQEACSKQKAGRKEAERTLFGALRLSWNILEPEEQEALLDIALTLKGQPWNLVQHHAGWFVTRRLCKLGLVKQQESETGKVATVHDTVSFFCSKADAIGHLPQRQVAATCSTVRQAQPCLPGESGGVGPPTMCIPLGRDALWW
jgi:hypothetical protein